MCSNIESDLTTPRIDYQHALDFYVFILSFHKAYRIRKSVCSKAKAKAKASVASNIGFYLSNVVLFVCTLNELFAPHLMRFQSTVRVYIHRDRKRHVTHRYCTMSIEVFDANHESQSLCSQKFVGNLAYVESSIGIILLGYRLQCDDEVTKTIV